MEVLPVIDLMDGQVVRGVGGRRESYRPVISQWSEDASPHSVASGFVRHFGLTSAYLADLNAIAGVPPDWEAYEAVAACGLRLWVDAGLSGDLSPPRLAQIAERGRDSESFVDGVIVGLESLPPDADLGALCRGIGQQRAVFSLDLKHDMPLTSWPAWAGLSPEQIAEQVVDAGFRRLIVLDLASVGSDQGPRTLGLCRKIRDRYPSLYLVTGGGVRGLDDLFALARAGCDAALVASALHDGKISRDDIEWIRGVGA